MAKTEFLQIRMTPEGSQRLSRVAEADHLDESTWARRAILQALERWDAEHQHGQPAADAKPDEKRQQRKVAESKPASQAKRPAKTPSKRKPRE